MDILRNYLETLKSLPNDLYRSLMLLRELDIKMQREIQQAEKMSAEYLVKILGLSAAEKYEEFCKIKGFYNKALILGDDKIALAGYAYEMVNHHIKRLDVELARFKAYIATVDELPDPALPPTPVVQTVRRKKSHKGGKKAKKGIQETNLDETRKSGRKRNKTKVSVQHA